MLSGASQVQLRNWTALNKYQKIDHTLTAVVVSQSRLRTGEENLWKSFANVAVYLNRPFTGSKCCLVPLIISSAPALPCRSLSLSTQVCKYYSLPIHRHFDILSSQLEIASILFALTASHHPQFEFVAVNLISAVSTLDLELIFVKIVPWNPNLSSPYHKTSPGLQCLYDS